MQIMWHSRSASEVLDSRRNSEYCDKESDFGNYKSVEFNSIEEVEIIGAIKDAIIGNITISGILEYMNLREQVKILKECRRIIEKNGTIKIRVPIIRDALLIDYYGWNSRPNVDIGDWASEANQGCLTNPSKCSFTPFSIALLARDSGLFVTGAFLRGVYFYEILLKINQDLDNFTSMEIVHNIFYCTAHRVGTTSELEYWAGCLDQGMEIDEMISNINVDYCNHFR